MNKKTICAIMLVCIITSTGSAYAGPPLVTVDEAVYVNLDYYGKLSDMSVVKSCSLNGNSEFTDYGKYDKVTNMTNYINPSVTQEGVTWHLEENTDRFYFECSPKKDEIILPWDFDVSYKLDGVPKKAEELAGVKGLVELNIEAIPNKNASEYYKNNMILQMASMVNMEDHFSLEAPGAQIQSMGTYKAVVFMALPGEHTSFTVRIGTDSFKTSGITMMMIPGTLKQLQDIKELKESKDKVNDAAHAVKDSMDDIIQTMENMSSGLSATKAGLSELDEARKTISGAKGQVYENADNALEDLQKLTDNVSSLVPHLKNGQSMIKDINEDINGIVSEIKNIKPDIQKYQDAMIQIQLDVEALKTLLEDINKKEEDRKEAFDRLSRNLDKLTENMDRLQLDSDNIGRGMDRLSDTAAQLGNVSGEINTIGNILGNIIINTTGGDAGTQAAVSIMKDSVSNMKQAAQQLLSSVSSVSMSAGTLFEDLENTFRYGASISDSLKSIIDMGDEYADLLSENHENNQDLLTQINQIGHTMENTLSTTKNMIEKIEKTNDTLNSYEQDTIALLKDSEDLAVQMSATLTSTVSFLTSLETMMKISGEKLDEGTKKTIEGLTDVLQKSIEGIGKTSNIKNANQLIQDTIDKELNRYEEENHILNIDAEHPLMSVTSEKNPTPSSVQIILRTEEINIDDEKEALMDLEKESENIGILERIANIFKKLYSAIVSIF